MWVSDIYALWMQNFQLLLDWTSKRCFAVRAFVLRYYFCTHPQDHTRTASPYMNELTVFYYGFPVSVYGFPSRMNEARRFQVGLHEVWIRARDTYWISFRNMGRDVGLYRLAFGVYIGLNTPCYHAILSCSCLLYTSRCV